MATLADRIRIQQKASNPLVRGPGGVLSQETEETIQSLAAKQGLQAPPTTALGQALIGATPDQQKMAGTPAQLQAALSLASQPVTNTLSGALRQQQVRSQASVQEEQSKQKSADMQNLGQLGERVTDFINAERDKLQAQAESGQVVAVDTANQFQGKDITSIKGLLAQLRQEPTNQNLLLQVNKALGYDINTQLNPAQVDQLYKSAVDAISTGAAGAIDDKLTVGDIINSGKFGYSPQDVAQLLGVPENNVAGMSIGQLRDAINQVGATEFNKTEQLEQQAQSGELGQAERGLARQAARELSRTGVRSSEADVAHLEQQIANADQVQFGGQSYNIEDLLKDDTISNIVSDYLNSAEGSPERTQLEATEPALVGFIKKNQELLQDASEHLKQGVATFQETQEANKALRSIGGVALNSDLLNTLAPQLNQLSSERIDVRAIPVLAAAQGLPVNEQKQYVSNINAAVADDPATIRDLQGLDAATLQAWDIGGGANSAWNTNYLQPKQLRNQIASLNNLDDAISLTTGGKYNSTTINQALDAAKAADTLGFGQGNMSLGDILDSNGDGRVDDLDSIRMKMLKTTPPPHLAGGPGSNQMLQAHDVGNPVGNMSEVQASIYNKLKDEAASGRISGDALKSANLNLDELVELETDNNKNIDQRTLDALHSQARNENTDYVFGELQYKPGADKQIEYLKDQLDSQGRLRLNEAAINNRIRQIADKVVADDLADAAKDRDKARRKLRQDRQFLAMVYPQFAALPPEGQDKIIEIATEAGNKGMSVFSNIKWDDNKTVPENILNIAGRAGISRDQALITAGVSAAKDTAGAVTKEGKNALKKAVQPVGKGISDIKKKIGL